MDRRGRLRGRAPARRPLDRPRLAAVRRREDAGRERPPCTRRRGRGARRHLVHRPDPDALVDRQGALRGRAAAAADGVVLPPGQPARRCPVHGRDRLDRPRRLRPGDEPARVGTLRKPRQPRLFPSGRRHSQAVRERRPDRQGRRPAGHRRRGPDVRSRRRRHRCPRREHAPADGGREQAGARARLRQPPAGRPERPASPRRPRAREEHGPARAHQGDAHGRRLGPGLRRRRRRRGRLRHGAGTRLGHGDRPAALVGVRVGAAGAFPGARVGARSRAARAGNSRLRDAPGSSGGGAPQRARAHVEQPQPGTGVRQHAGAGRGCPAHVVERLVPECGGDRRDREPRPATGPGRVAPGAGAPDHRECPHSRAGRAAREGGAADGVARARAGAARPVHEDRSRHAGGARPPDRRVREASLSGRSAC